MSLANQTAWIVGGVGVIGRGIARGFLQAGAKVIVNSSNDARLEQIEKDLNHPANLVLIHGDLLPGSVESTLEKAMIGSGSLNHVVAHGAVRYWSEKTVGCDETFLLNTSQRLLDMNPDEFVNASSQLATMHFTAAKFLIPMLKKENATYSFVTGDGGGHLSGNRSCFGEINSHHVWGLSAALRRELDSSNVACREIRVRLPINRSAKERMENPRERPLSEDIGDLCAGIAATGGKQHIGELIEIDSKKTLEDYLVKFNADEDKNINLPHIWEFTGSI